MRVFLLLLLLALTLTVPTQFDLRVQSSILQLADYELRVEGLCAGYTWAKELAQVLSNALSLKTGEKISLSAQHILECTQTDTDICYKATYQNILDAFDHISTVGVTTDTCYPNRPLEMPHSCQRTCHNGEKFDFIYKVPLTKYDNIKAIFDLMKKNEKMAAFALLKVNDSFNFYNSLAPVLDKKPSSEFYEFRVAEILGWKNQQEKVILRAGPGQGWGFGGYIDLNVTQYKEYIQQYYYVDLSNFQPNLRVESQ